MSFLTNIEFYVIAVLVAAVIIAFSALPKRRGPARQYLLAGELSMTDGISSPSISLKVEENGSVTLTRYGLADLTEAGAVSLAIEVVGFDVEIKERIVSSTTPAWDINTATFHLDFFAPERYHLHYSNRDLGLSAATSLRVRPGIAITKQLV